MKDDQWQFASAKINGKVYIYGLVKPSSRMSSYFKFENVPTIQPMELL